MNVTLKAILHGCDDIHNGDHTLVLHYARPTDRDDARRLLDNAIATNTTEPSDTYGTEARELDLYMMNDSAIYHAYYLPVALNLQKKWQKGEYDKDLGIKGMRRAVDAAAKQYNREHGSMSTPWHKLFSVGDRDAVAENLVDNLVAEWRLGNFL